jgi:hypothetical protein
VRDRGLRGRLAGLAWGLAQIGRVRGPMDRTSEGAELSATSSVVRFCSSPSAERRASLAVHGGRTSEILKVRVSNNVRHDGKITKAVISRSLEKKPTRVPRMSSARRQSSSVSSTTV